MKAMEFKINVDTTAVDELIEKLNRVNKLTIKKDISDMTNEEILRQQLELLAELSLRADFDELPRLSTAMVAIHEILKC
ncbi:hypothetical protein [Acetobacterium wieringae]|uniref:hypothetical protein n=1 Tax=Acetobacterium wieringae TaxID=52694 RepID=UPI003158C279